MLTFSDWLSIKKEAAYKLYVQLLKTLAAKEQFICKAVTKLAKYKTTTDS